MIARRFLSILSFVMAVTAPTLPARAEASGIERLGLYVVSDDLDRSSDFYEMLFAKQPQVRNAGLVGFDVAGGFYAIVSKTEYAPSSVRGDNVVPYIKVDDVFAQFERVKSMSPASLQSTRVIEEGSFKFFKLADPDGNIIEFFSILDSTL